MFITHRGWRSKAVAQTLAQMFFCEFCEISKNTFFYRTPLVAASGRFNFIEMICLTDINQINCWIEILKSKKNKVFL